MKIIEKWGTGIPRIFRECKEYGLPEPQLIDFDGDFRVNLYRKMETDTKIGASIETDRTNVETNTKTDTEKVMTDTETISKIIELMKVQPTITAKQIAGILGISLSGVRYHINKMKKDGLLEHIGASKKGTWVIHLNK